MKFYSVLFPQNCELNYPVRLPGGKCAECGKFVPSSACGYPGVDGVLAQAIVRSYQGSILSMTAFRKLEQQLRPLFPTGAYLGGSTCCGLPAGRILFKHKDMLFSPENVLLTDAGLERARTAGIHGIRITPIRLSLGKQPAAALHILDFDHSLEEPEHFFSAACPSCGLRKRLHAGHAQILRRSLKGEYDLCGFKSEGVRLIVVSERFRELALELHGGKGLKFGEIPVVD
jgi:hypothetical protein